MQLYFVAANMAAVPITAVLAMPAGLLALALMPFGLERAALVPMGWGVEAILWIGRAVSAWPAATLAVPHLPGWGLALFALGLAWLCLWRTPRVRLAGIAAMLAGLLSPLAAPPPDVVVSADARLIGVRGADALLVQPGRGGAGFLADAWRSYLGVASVRPLEEGAACDADGCRVERGGAAALVLRPRGEARECAGVAVLVSPEPVRGGCRGVPAVDRVSVWRDGAHAIWLGRGARGSCPTGRGGASGPGCRRGRSRHGGCRTCPWRRWRLCRRSRRALVRNRDGGWRPTLDATPLGPLLGRNA